MGALPFNRLALVAGFDLLSRRVIATGHFIVSDRYVSKECKLSVTWISRIPMGSKKTDTLSDGITRGYFQVYTL